MCKRECCFRLLAWRNDFWQVRHWKCFSLVCMTLCRFSSPAWVNALLQIPHWYVLSPVCIRLPLQTESLSKSFPTDNKLVMYVLSAQERILFLLPANCFWQIIHWKHLPLYVWGCDTSGHCLEWMICYRCHIDVVSLICVKLCLFRLPVSTNVLLQVPHW